MQNFCCDATMMHKISFTNQFNFQCNYSRSISMTTRKNQFRSPTDRTPERRNRTVSRGYLLTTSFHGTATVWLAGMAGGVENYPIISSSSTRRRYVRRTLSHVKLSRPIRSLCGGLPSHTKLSPTKKMTTKLYKRK